MQRITLFGMVLLSAFAIAGVSALSVSANGHEFVVSKTGKTKSKGTNAQIFKTSAGTIECSTVTGTGEMTETKSVTHKEVLTYSECSGFGMGIKVTAAHFEFNANGSARLEKTVVRHAGRRRMRSADRTAVARKPRLHELERQADGVSRRLQNPLTRGPGGVCGGENTKAATRAASRAKSKAARSNGNSLAVAARAGGGEGGGAAGPHCGPPASRGRAPVGNRGAVVAARG